MRMSIRESGTDQGRERRAQQARGTWAVILAGGDGTRLQPLTRLISGDGRPKQFCPMFCRHSMTFRNRESWSSRWIEEPPPPSPGVMLVLQQDDDPLVAVFPSYHYYADELRFRLAFRSALGMARSTRIR